MLFRVLIDHFEDGIGNLLLPPIGDDHIEIFVHFLILLAQLKLYEILKNSKMHLTFIFFTSSSSKTPISYVSAALTSPRGGMSGGLSRRRKTVCQSTFAKNRCDFSSSALCGYGLG
jgi:hypothetical protein